jgi:peptidylprolyl isomerase
MTQANTGDTVQIHYSGKLNDGTVFDFSDGKSPLEFKIGENTVIPHLEQSVIGMTIGDKATVEINTENAYGPHQTDAIQTVDRSMIPQEVDLTVGASCRRQHPTTRRSCSRWRRHDSYARRQSSPGGPGSYLRHRTRRDRGDGLTPSPSPEKQTATGENRRWPFRFLIWAGTRQAATVRCDAEFLFRFRRRGGREGPSDGPFEFFCGRRFSPSIRASPSSAASTPGLRSVRCGWPPGLELWRLFRAGRLPGRLFLAAPSLG